MLVSQIISQGTSYADVPNTSFFTAADALDSVQNSWNEIYAELLSKDDDFFLTEVYVNSSTFTPDANAAYTYFYTLPADFQTLRLFQYQGQYGTSFFPCTKMTIENFGSTQNTPSYRLTGTFLTIYDPVGYSKYRVFYYPKVATLATNTDLAYPVQMIPQIMEYKLAADILRKMNRDPGLKEARWKELFAAMVSQISRDENKAEQIKDSFSRGFGPYI